MIRQRRTYRNKSITKFRGTTTKRVHAIKQLPNTKQFHCTSARTTDKIIFAKTPYNLNRHIPKKAWDKIPGQSLNPTTHPRAIKQIARHLAIAWKTGLDQWRLAAEHISQVNSNQNPT